MKKILQCTMGLDIGGAETHVVELSKALVKKGYHVTVASNGGVYEQELLAHGVHLVKLPLHRKRPMDVIRSLIGLRKLIKTLKPDIVHAHARIPALYVSFLNRHHRFRMITTAHGKFKINWLLKRLTQWGKEIYVVSEDIRDYLLENYTVEDATIFETVNGIDTDRFKEKDVSKAYKTIVHVSRLDDNTSLAAQLLIEYAKTSDYHIHIVGDGNALPSLKQEAAGLSNVTFAGASSHVEAELQKADIFVGISRSALEAMSMNIPTVLCGDYGFMGMMTKEHIPLAKMTNFTARVPQKPTLALLKEAIEGITEFPYSHFNWQRAFIQSHYSVSKMCADYLVSYEKTDDKKVFIVGYYGSHNLGDELLLQETIKLCEGYTPRHHISALSYHVTSTVQMHKIKGVSRNKFFKIMSSIKSCDVVICGGGSMLQNITSNRSLIYYLALLNYATFQNKTVLMLGNGIGPIKGRLQEAMVIKTLKKLDYIHLRDEGSYQWVKRFRDNHVDLGSDLAFSTPIDVHAEKSMSILLNLRKWPHVDTLTSPISTFLDQQKSRGYTVSCLSMQRGNDDVVLSTFGNVLPHASIDELVRDVASAKIVVAMRLHTLILSASLKIPFIGIAYDPKVAFFCKSMNMPYFESLDTVNADQLNQMFLDLEAHYDSYVSLLDTRIHNLMAQNASMHEAIKAHLSS